MYLPKALKPNPRPTFQRHTQTIHLLFECERLYLRSVSPVGSCGWGHLALLTAGSCFCIHMGIRGKFPARTSCVGLQIVATIHAHKMSFMLGRFLLAGRELEAAPVASPQTSIVFLPERVTAGGASASFLGLKTQAERGLRCVHVSTRTNVTTSG